MSAAALGSLKASTIATVAVVELAGSLYALTTSVGPYPDGVTFGPIAMVERMSVRRSARQAIWRAWVGAAQARTTLLCAGAACAGVPAASKPATRATVQATPVAARATVALTLRG